MQCLHSFSTGRLLLLRLSKLVLNRPIIQVSYRMYTIWLFKETSSHQVYFKIRPTMSGSSCRRRRRLRHFRIRPIIIPTTGSCEIRLQSLGPGKKNLPPTPIFLWPRKFSFRKGFNLKNLNSPPSKLWRLSSHKESHESFRRNKSLGFFFFFSFSAGWEIFVEIKFNY